MNKSTSSHIEKDVFRIMRHKLKGNNSSVELKCWQMVAIAKTMFKRFGVFPYKIKLKHLLWYCDERLIWHRSAHTAYRYYLVIKDFSICRDMWPQWKNQVSQQRPW